MLQNGICNQVTTVKVEPVDFIPECKCIYSLSYIRPASNDAPFSMRTLRLVRLIVESRILAKQALDFFKNEDVRNSLEEVTEICSAPDKELKIRRRPREFLPVQRIRLDELC
jgi:hypothetical protein